MSEMRVIEIDFDVHKRIEAERRSFAETENAVLRRLLGLDNTKNDALQDPDGELMSLRAWAGKGVMLPHGTVFRMEYNGILYQGMIADGRWAIDGREYSSPSAAAGGVAKTKLGTRTTLDGWKLWQVKRPTDDKWRRLSELKPLVWL